MWKVPLAFIEIAILYHDQIWCGAPHCSTIHVTIFNAMFCLNWLEWFGWLDAVVATELFITLYSCNYIHIKFRVDCKHWPEWPFYSRRKLQVLATKFSVLKYKKCYLAHTLWWKLHYNTSNNRNLRLMPYFFFSPTICSTWSRKISVNNKDCYSGR